MNEKLDTVIFYSIEKAIKSYRQFAQRELKKAGLTITVDQWLTLKGLADHPEMNQKELAGLVFKDAASITRILDLLEAAELLKRIPDKNDRRNSLIQITRQGKELLAATGKVVLKYRAHALRNIPTQHLRIADSVLNAIQSNCN